MGACIALHAELNACIRAGERARGATVYITEEPCDGCIKVMKSAGAAEAVWYGGRLDLCPKKPAPGGLRKLFAKVARICF
jgi:tRNA(Arg) A34 adenosine deaminase TadA